MKKIYVGIAVVTILAVAFGAVTIASADEHNPPQRQRGQKDGPFHELFLENLAEALGTTRDDLQSRIESGEKLPDIAAEYGYEGEALKELMASVQQATVDEALAEGLITKEEAEKILAHSGRKGPGRRGGQGQGNPIIREYFINNLAEALGTTSDDLQSRIESGEKLPDIAAEYGYEGEALKELMASVQQAAVDEALAEGLITEEEAEKILAHSGRKGPGRRGGQGQGNPILGEYFINNLAEALGLSVDELKAMKEDGQTLEDLGYSKEELKEIFQQAREDAIEEALADGVITEEQLEQFQNRKNKIH